MILEPQRSEAVSLILEAVSSGCRLFKACECLEIDIRTYKRWSSENGLVDKRNGPLSLPKHALTEVEKQTIKTICTSDLYRDASPAQIVPRLADEGRYIASESSFYRVLHALELDPHRGRARPRKTQNTQPLSAQKPNQIWSWDISYLPTRVMGQFFYLYMVMDIYSRKIVSAEVFTVESAEHATQLFKAATQKEKIDPDQISPLHIHADNGSVMKSSTLLATFQSLGLIPSYSRPSVSDDNPFSESLFRTTKYCPLYPTKPFESLLAAREWLNQFIHWYNTIHRHSGIGFVTPEQRHNNESEAIFKARYAIYETAKQKHPFRWSGGIRKWESSQEVVLKHTRTLRSAAA